MKRKYLLLLGISALIMIIISTFYIYRHKITIIRDIEYASYQINGEEKKLLLDLYLPAQRTAQAEPLLIYIHGGGWREKDKTYCPGEDVAKRGYPIACISYRFSQEAIFPAQIHDVKGAVRWLRANAAKYNFDPNQFGAWGASAGGHLSTLLGTSGGVESLEGKQGNIELSSRVQGVCNWYGPTDFTKVPPTFTSPATPEVVKKNRGKPWLIYTVATSELLGGPVAENLELAALANPINYIDSQDPPVMIMHGELDNVVPISQSEILAKALAKNGVEVEFVRFRERGHTYHNPVNQKPN